MIVRINGQDIELEDGLSIEQFLLRKKIKPESIVVEYNCRIIDKSEWLNVVLKDADVLEIISFVGGGAWKTSL